MHPISRSLGLALLLAACGAPGDPSPPPADTTAGSPVTGPPAPPPGADSTASDSILVGDPPTLVPGPLRTLPRDWTTRTTDLARPGAPTATLREVRAAAQDGFDRVVFGFDGPVPSVQVEYVDRPAHACGSGEALYLAGDAWLRVGFRPAQAHTDAGIPTITERRATYDLPVLREAALTCDFEADVTWVLGLSAPGGYRLLELTDLPRLVVDVRH